MVAESHKRLRIDPHLRPHATRALHNFLHAELIVTSGNRCVRGKHAAIAHLLDRVSERNAGDTQLTHALDHHERRVSFVGVPRCRLDAHRAQGTHTANAEQPFLPETHRWPARIELG